MSKNKEYMYAVRTVQNISSERITIEVPEAFWGQEVEIIIFPLQVIRSQHKQSLRGCLKQYAKPELIDKEATAWQEAIREKYANR